MTRRPTSAHDNPPRSGEHLYDRERNPDVDFRRIVGDSTRRGHYQDILRTHSPVSQALRTHALTQAGAAHKVEVVARAPGDDEAMREAKAWDWILKHRFGKDRGANWTAFIDRRARATLAHGFSVWAFGAGVMEYPGDEDTPPMAVMGITEAIEIPLWSIDPTRPFVWEDGQVVGVRQYPIDSEGRIIGAAEPVEGLVCIFTFEGEGEDPRGAPLFRSVELLLQIAEILEKSSAQVAEQSAFPVPALVPRPGEEGADYERKLAADKALQGQVKDFLTMMSSGDPSAYAMIPAGVDLIYHQSDPQTIQYAMDWLDRIDRVTLRAGMVGDAMVGETAVGARSVGEVKKGSRLDFCDQHMRMDLARFRELVMVPLHAATFGPGTEPPTLDVRGILPDVDVDQAKLAQAEGILLRVEKRELPAAAARALLVDGLKLGHDWVDKALTAIEERRAETQAAGGIESVPVPQSDTMQGVLAVAQAVGGGLISHDFVGPFLEWAQVPPKVRDAMIEAVRPKTAAPDATPEPAPDVKPPSALSEAPPVRLVYSGIRELTASELAADMDPEEMRRARDEMEVDIADQLRTIAQQVAAQVAAEFEDRINAGEAGIAAAMTARVSELLATRRDEMLEAIRQAQEAGAAEVRRELQAQGLNAPPESNIDVGVLAGMIDMIEATLVGAIVAALAAEAVRMREAGEVPLTPDERAERAAADAAFRSKPEIQTAARRAWGQGRDAVLTGAEADRIQRSIVVEGSAGGARVPDKRVCSVCIPHDMKVVEQGSAEHLAIGLTLTRGCLGGSRCRCLWLAVVPGQPPPLG